MRRTANVLRNRSKAKYVVKKVAPFIVSFLLSFQTTDFKKPFAKVSRSVNYIENTLLTVLKGHYGCFLGEMMLIWEGNKLGQKRYTHKPVSPLMGSESPCCGGGLSGISVLYSLHILILNNPQIQYFSMFPRF